MHTLQFLTNASVLGKTTPRSLQILPGSHFFFEGMSRDKCNSPPPQKKKKKTTSDCFYRSIYHRLTLHCVHNISDIFFFFLYGLRLICRLVLVRVTYKRAPRPLRGLFARITGLEIDLSVTNECKCFRNLTNNSLSIHGIREIMDT